MVIALGEQTLGLFLSNGCSELPSGKLQTKPKRFIYKKSV